MRTDQITAYKRRRDVNLKLLKSTQVIAIKNKRAKFRREQKASIAKAERKRTTARNLGALSKRQLKKRNKRQEKLNVRRKKYKYEKAGLKGNIAFQEIFDKTKGIDNFTSSNVGKMKRRGKNIMVMFLDGSIYMYFNVSAKYIGLINAGSKGKGVGNQLIRKKVKYAKLR